MVSRILLDTVAKRKVVVSLLGIELIIKLIGRLLTKLSQP